MYKRAYFMGLTFTVHESTVKTVKIGPLENFPLYGITLGLFGKGGSPPPPPPPPPQNWLSLL